jgi:hypothetical protein
MWKLFFKGKIGIIKKASQKFVTSLYISIDISRQISHYKNTKTISKNWHQTILIQKVWHFLRIFQQTNP